MSKNHGLMPGDEVTDGNTKGRVISRGASRKDGYEVTVKSGDTERTYRNSEIDTLRKR